MTKQNKQHHENESYCISKQIDYKMNYPNGYSNLSAAKGKGKGKGVPPPMGYGKGGKGKGKGKGYAPAPYAPPAVVRYDAGPAPPVYNSPVLGPAPAPLVVRNRVATPHNYQMKDMVASPAPAMLPVDTTIPLSVPQTGDA